MQQLLGYMRRAVTQYNMISPGDKIAVGVSGGKDSVALLIGLHRLSRFLGVEYSVVGITLDPGFEGVQSDYSQLINLCEQEGIEYIVKPTEIGKIVFDHRQETNPCSLCARMRRGALHDLTKELGCNKIALGHHYNDAVETFMMNLFREGRVGCFSPVTYLSRKDITMIRPLCVAPEKDIASAVRRCGLPVVKSRCPVDSATARQGMKEFLRGLEREDKGITQRIFGAMVRGNISGW